MRLYRPKDNRQTNPRPLLLADYSESAHLDVLVANQNSASVTVAVGTTRPAELLLATDPTEIESWPHWGINE
jgi:hypothetical protein